MSVLSSAWIGFLGMASAAGAQGDLKSLAAHVHTTQYTVDLGKPILVEFSLENPGDTPVRIDYGTGNPGPKGEEAMGLPLAHIFSGPPEKTLPIYDIQGRRFISRFTRGAVPEPYPITVAPRCSVGRLVNLLDFFPELRLPGRYRIVWTPFGGALISNAIFVTVSPLKQAEIITDMGTMTVRFYYEDAPTTVANFIELAESGFYSNTAFHKLRPGYYIQGGDRVGDGNGIRDDGKMLPPEFNDQPHQKGSLSMALREDDPNTASSQFFICNTRYPDWDGKYTVFGQLVGQESFETLERLMATPVSEVDYKPLRPLYVRAIKISTIPTDWREQEEQALLAAPRNP